MDATRQAAVDPEALRALSAELMTLSSKIAEMRDDLDRGLVILGYTFQDEQYHEFRASFLSSKEKLMAFIEEVRGLAPKLEQDAADILAAQRVQMEK